MPDTKGASDSNKKQGMLSHILVNIKLILISSKFAVGRVF
jgi:hypothetical protein